MLNARLIRDLKNLSRSPPAGISGAYDGHEGGLAIVSCIIDGPPDTPYEGGSFRVTLWISPRFPHEPPLAKFMTRIYHPNIDSEGRICLDTLKVAPTVSLSRLGYWNPDLSISAVLLTLQSLLASPNPEDGLDQSICSLYMNNYNQFWTNAQIYTQRYAKQLPAIAPQFPLKDITAFDEQKVLRGDLKWVLGDHDRENMRTSNTSDTVAPEMKLQIPISVEPTFLLSKPRSRFVLKPKVASQGASSKDEDPGTTMSTQMRDLTNVAMSTSPSGSFGREMDDRSSFLGVKRSQREFYGTENASEMVQQLSARKPCAVWTWDQFSGESNSNEVENIAHPGQPEVSSAAPTLMAVALAAQCERYIQEEVKEISSLTSSDLIARMRGKRILLGAPKDSLNYHVSPHKQKFSLSSPTYSFSENQLHNEAVGPGTKFVEGKCHSMECQEASFSNQAGQEEAILLRESMTSPPPDQMVEMAYQASPEALSMGTSHDASYRT